MILKAQVRLDSESPMDKPLLNFYETRCDGSVYVSPGSRCMLGAQVSIVKHALVFCIKVFKQNIV